MGATNRQVMGSFTYNDEVMRKVCMLLKITNLQREKLPSINGDHPKLYLSLIMCEEQHHTGAAHASIKYLDGNGF